MLDLIRLSIFNPQPTCTIDSYINCELYRLEYKINDPIDRNIVQLNRDRLRKQLGLPNIRTIPIIRDKLKEKGIIKDWKEIKPTQREQNMIVVYKEEGKTTRHATCVIGELDFHWVITGGNGRVLLPKEGKYKFYQYVK